MNDEKKRGPKPTIDDAIKRSMWWPKKLYSKIEIEARKASISVSEFVRKSVENVLK